ncbi:MAG: hypothetical protein QOD30_907, partial [Actinomycetota bacterium]|nr:hypothetical protein [Actinomycetota bacterium]
MILSDLECLPDSKPARERSEPRIGAADTRRRKLAGAVGRS